MRVGPLLLEAVAIALDVAAATDGLVDPTVGRTLRLAGYDRTLRRASSSATAARFRASFASGAGLARASSSTDAAGTVALAEGVELDLGATAKALAADRAARAAAAARAGTGVLVTLGGDIAIAGPAPDGGWPVRDRRRPRRAARRARADGRADRAGGLATSGTAVRRWQAARRRRSTTSSTRAPAGPAETPWRTVTVAAATCVDANAASTAAIVLGEDAPAWLEAARASRPARRARPARSSGRRLAGGARVMLAAATDRARTGT